MLGVYHWSLVGRDRRGSSIHRKSRGNRRSPCDHWGSGDQARRCIGSPRWATRNSAVQGDATREASARSDRNG
jgi:hypothetical protein